MCDKLFIRAILKTGLVYYFSQVWLPFNIYELFIDGMGSYPECVLTSFWSSSGKSTDFWFAGLNTIFSNLCYAVAIDGGFKYFLQKTARIPPRFSRVEPLMFSNDISLSPFLREWKKLILSFSVSWLWILRLVWKKIFEELKLCRFPVKRGHRCRERFGQFGKSVDIVMEICRIFVVCQLLKGQQNLVCFNRRRGILIDDVLEEQYVTSSWTRVIMSWPSSTSECRVVWFCKRLASGWG